MKKRLACLFLGLTLCFGLRPALAAEAGVFSDVRDSDWFAPYVRVCVDHGLMEGTGTGRFEPDRELTLMEVWALEAKLEAWARGESVPHFPVVSLSDLAVFYDGTGARLGTIGDCIYEPKVYYGYNTFYFTLPQELQVQAGEGAVTLELNLDVLKAWPKDPLEEFRPLPEGSVRYEGGWDASRSCYIIPFGDDLDGKGPELLKLLDGLMTTEELLKEAWFRDSLLYTSSIGAHGLLSELHLDEFSAMADSQEQIDWSQREPAVRADLLGLLDAAGFDEHEFLMWELPEEERQELGRETVQLQGLFLLGILNGVDEKGTMAPEDHLTRAQVAAVLARTLHPELRVGAEGYTLTPVELGDWEPRGIAADWLALEREGPGGTTEGAIYRADGAFLTLDGGRVWVDEEEPSLGASHLAAVYRGDLWGVYDVAAGEFTLPYTKQAMPIQNQALSPDTQSRYAVMKDQYYSYEGSPISPYFGWAGPLNASGGGFVADWMQIYHIQFKEET